MRVRYAPSPTGEPHLGNIRTALFNWLFARRNDGVFIVRIEDTDQERLVHGAMEAILDALRWLGLDWDEGPTGAGTECKGGYGSYFQSQRLPLYHSHVEQLIRSGHAYRCYCSPARLEAVRLAQQQQKLPPGYDGHCRDLPAEERRRREEGGEPCVVRFRIPLDGATTVHDLVRSEVTWENRLLGDMVILKSDGFPTYHLASVVDDHHMHVSHVLRAEEWLPSTPRHLLLYQAFGWEPPRFAHLPMILGADRAKLSKRHGATSVLAYRDDGYLPDAMLNFMALLGWSLDDKTTVISRPELMQHFSLERITKAPAIFDKEKLAWMNGHYIRALSDEALGPKLLPFLERPAESGGLPADVRRPLDRGYVLRVVPLVKDRLKLLSEAPALTAFLFQERLAYEPALLVQKGMTAESAVDALRQARLRLSPLASDGRWTAPYLEEALRPLAAELKLTTGQLFGALRVAVTGQTAAPPLFQTMEVLGRDRCLARLEQAVAALLG